MTHERRIWHLSTTAIVFMLILGGRMVYWQFVRGPILAPNAQAVAKTPAADENYTDTNHTAEPTEVATPGPRPTAQPAVGPSPGPTASPQAPNVILAENKNYMPLVFGANGSRASLPRKTPGATVLPESTSTTPAAPGLTVTGTLTSTTAPPPTPTLDASGLLRGTLYDRNGRRLAYDHKDAEGKLLRFYAEPSLAHVVGYVSGVRTGVTGIERAYDETLLGFGNPEKAIDPTVPGNDLFLTIDSRVQRTAADMLTGKAGAIVVMDAHTGAVLAMVSTPYFDPNRILEPDYLHELENCDGSVQCRQALFNRAAQGWYTPGSTWKTVTLIAALESGQVTPQTVFDFGPPLRDARGRIYYVYMVDSFPIVDPNHEEQHLGLVDAYARSANAAFARIGDEMAADVMLEYATRLGFGRASDRVPPIEIDASAPRLAIDPQALHSNDLLRASTAIGQGELQVSPLSMALLMAAVVNDGRIPKPHLVQAVHRPSGAVIAGESVEDWISNAIQPETARLVRDMMVEVVQNGSGFRANVPGLVVGGKTGTAQLGDDLPPHAWFTGFVQDNERAVVIALIIENGGEGAQGAAPLFAQVADVAMRHRGEAVEEIVPAPTVP